MAGVTNIYEDSYLAEEAITERFVLVYRSAEGKCKLPAAAGDDAKILGVAQTTALANQPVLVRKAGTSYLVADAAIAAGAKVAAKVGGNKGRGITLADPASPATGDQVLTVLNTHVATAQTAAAAMGDIIQVTLPGPGLR